MCVPQEEEVPQPVPERGDGSPDQDEGGQIPAVAAAFVERSKRRVVAGLRHEPVVRSGRFVEEIHEEHAGEEENGRTPEIAEDQFFRLRCLRVPHEDRGAVDGDQTVAHEAADAEIIPEGIVEPVREKQSGPGAEDSGVENDGSKEGVELRTEGTGAGGVRPGVEGDQHVHEAADVDRQGVDREAADEEGDEVFAEAEKEDERTDNAFGGLPAPRDKASVDEGIGDRGRKKEGGLRSCKQ